MLSPDQKIPMRSVRSRPIRLPTVPRARDLVSPRAGPWITVESLTRIRH